MRERASRVDREAACGDLAGPDRSADLEQSGNFEGRVHRGAVTGRAAFEGRSRRPDRVGARQSRTAADGDLVEAVNALPRVALCDGGAVGEGEGGAVDGDDLPGALDGSVGGGDLDPVADDVGRDRGLVGDEGDVRAAGLGDARAERGQDGRLAVDALVVDDRSPKVESGPLTNTVPAPPKWPLDPPAEASSRGERQGERCRRVRARWRRRHHCRGQHWSGAAFGLDGAFARGVTGDRDPDRASGARVALPCPAAVGADCAVADEVPPTSSRMMPPPASPCSTL